MKRGSRNAMAVPLKNMRCTPNLKMRKVKYFVIKVIFGCPFSIASENGVLGVLQE